MLAALVVTLLFTALTGVQQTELSNKMIRLHVIANSDSQADQAVKLKVRDRVLKEIEILTDGVCDKDTAEQIITKNITQIGYAASEELHKNGSANVAMANISREYYPTREYETFSLPAGEYTSLRVVIGEGKGHNWWCVVFPPVCTAAAVEESAAVSLTDEEISLITEDSTGYVVKFKMMEILGRLKQWMTKT